MYHTTRKGSAEPHRTPVLIKTNQAPRLLKIECACKASSNVRLSEADGNKGF